MSTQMKQLRGTAAEWATDNRVLEDGEIGWVTDTHVFKIGDGVNPWNSLPMGFLNSSLIQADGDILVGTGPGTATRLPKGSAQQRLTIDDAGVLVWADLPPVANPFDVVDALGDLIVGQGDGSVVKLPRGATNQRLTVNTDGTLGWVDMPDLTGFELATHAASTYETLAHAASTYETKASASNYELASHAASTYLDLASAASTYESQAHASTTYAPISSTEVKHSYIEKTADQSKSNNAGLGVDSELRIGVDINSVWLFDAFLVYTGGAGDIQIGINGPAGSTVMFAATGPHNAATASGAQGEYIAKLENTPLTDNIPFGCVSGVNTFIRIRGRIKVAATQGYLGFAWAQANSNATATIVRAGSFAEARRN